MKIIHNEFNEFLGLLIKEKVEFLLIGGFAVAYHGYVRYTGDMDVWINATPDNASKLIAVIDAFGFETDELLNLDFAKEPLVFHMGKEPLKIDVTTHISGVKFTDCYPFRIEAVIDGMLIPFIGLEDLKKNKKWSGRLKDLNDLENLP